MSRDTKSSDLLGHSRPGISLHNELNLSTSVLGFLWCGLRPMPVTSMSISRQWRNLASRKMNIVAMKFLGAAVARLSSSMSAQTASLKSHVNTALPPETRSPKARNPSLEPTVHFRGSRRCRRFLAAPRAPSCAPGRKSTTQAFFCV